MIGLTTDEFNEDEMFQVRLFPCLTQDSLFWCFTRFHRPRRNLQTGLRMVRVSKQQEFHPAGRTAGDISECLALRDGHGLIPLAIMEMEGHYTEFG